MSSRKLPVVLPALAVTLLTVLREPDRERSHADREGSHIGRAADVARAALAASALVPALLPGPQHASGCQAASSFGVAGPWPPRPPAGCVHCPNAPPKKKHDVRAPSRQSHGIAT